MGGDAPTYKSSQGKLSELVSGGTIPSYQSDRGRYDAFATDNDGFIVDLVVLIVMLHILQIMQILGQECHQNQAELILQHLTGQQSLLILPK